VKPATIIEAITDPAFDPRYMDQQHGIVSLVLGGASAGFTGHNTAAVTNDMQRLGVSVQGNILASPDVLTATLNKFLDLSQNPSMSLADRLLGALEAGSRQGGDRRCGEQTAISAYLIVAKPEDSADNPSLKITIPLQYRYSKNAVKLLREEYDLLKRR